MVLFGRAPIGSGFALQVLTKLRFASFASGLSTSIPHAGRIVHATVQLFFST
jgi:hypothetical protein